MELRAYGRWVCGWPGLAALLAAVLPSSLLASAYLAPPGERPGLVLNIPFLARTPLLPPPGSGRPHLQATAPAKVAEAAAPLPFQRRDLFPADSLFATGSSKRDPQRGRTRSASIRIDPALRTESSEVTPVETIPLPELPPLNPSPAADPWAGRQRSRPPEQIFEEINLSRDYYGSLELLNPDEVLEYLESSGPDGDRREGVKVPFRLPVDGRPPTLESRSRARYDVTD